MSRRRSILPLLALALPLAFAAASHAQAPDWKKIRIAVEGAYPPFSEVAPDGQIRGFDIDIANALCARLQAECTLVPQEWDGMIPALNARKFDAIIASMSITEERRRAVLFSVKYYATPARLVAKANTPMQPTPAGLKGHRIGVQRQTTQDRYATDIFRDSEIVRYAKMDEAFLDLSAGRIDAMLVDSVAADYGFLRRPAGKGFAFFGPPFVDEKYFGEGAAVAMRKSDTALKAKFDAAIAALRADGGYARIASKYFTFDVYGPERK